MSGVTRRSLLLGSAAAPVLTAITARAAAAGAPVDPPPPGWEDDLTPIHAPKVRGLTISVPPFPLNVGQDGHNAFPGLARLADGTLWLTWRHGTHHVTGRDGVIMQAFSTDSGMTWHDVHVGAGGADHRDPSPFVDPVTGQAHLTWFTGSDQNPALGAFTEAGGGPTVRRIDPGLPYAAMCAPLVRLPDQRLGAAFYGRQAGEAIDTAFMAWSSDNGNSWSSNRVVNAIGAGVHYNEPVLLVDAPGTTYFFHRAGMADGIAMRTSPDSGRSWTGPTRRILDHASGRPSVGLVDDQTIVMVYRALPSCDARIAYSADRGATWRDGGVLMPSRGGLGCVYAAMVPTAARQLTGVVAMEEGGSTWARLFGFQLATTGP